MASITVHAGDFGKGKASLNFGAIVFAWQAGDGWSGGKTLMLNQLETVEIASEESVKRVAGTVGWGAVGSVLLGPVGLLAGLLAGGRKTEVTFVARTKDGKKFLASADSAAYKKIAAAVF